MSDKPITQQVAEVRNRIAAIQLELDDNQAARIKLREEREVLSKLLASLGVEAQVQEHVAKAASASQAAQEAHAAAEKLRQDAQANAATIEAQKKELAELIEKAKAVKQPE